MASYFRLLTLDTVFYIILYPPRFWLEIIEIIKIESPLILIGMKQNKIRFSTPPILNIFSLKTQKMHF